MTTDFEMPDPDTMPMSVSAPVSAQQHLVCPACGQRIRQGRYAALRRFVHSPAYLRAGTHVDVEDIDGDWHRVTRSVIEETYGDADEDMAATVELCAFGFLTAVEAAGLIGASAGAIAIRLRAFWEMVVTSAPKVKTR